MGTTNLKALQDAVKLIVDAVNDSIKVAATGGNPLVALASYQNLIPDLMTLAPEIGEIPADVSAMNPSDYVTLVTGLVGQLGLTDAHVGTILGAALGLLQHIVADVLPSTTALIAAVQGPAAVTAPMPTSAAS